MRVMLGALLLLAGCNGRSYDLDGGDLVTVGKAFVEQRGCPMCHQSSSTFDGVLSGQSTPLVGTMVFGSNLTPDHLTGIGDWADIEIVRAMRYGVDDRQEALCPQMPHHDGKDLKLPYMTDLEASAIIAYLRSLPAVTRLDGGIPRSRCMPPPDDMSLPPTDDLSSSFPADMAIHRLLDMAPDMAPDMALAPPPDLAGDLGTPLIDGGTPNG